MRNNTVDLVKGFCMLLVVVGHFNPPNAPAWFEIVHDFIYTLHMPVFMAMSGYLYANSRDDGGVIATLRKKFLRLMVPYFSLSLIITTVKLVASRFVTLDSGAEAATYLRILYLPEAAAFLWFAYTLFLIFVVMSVTKSIPHRLAILSPIAIALFFIPLEFPKAMMLNDFKRMFVFFLAGMVLQKVQTRFPIRSMWIPAILFPAHIAMFYLFTRSPGATLWFALSLSMGLAGIAYLFAFFQAKQHLVAWMKPFSVIALHGTPIYLLHTSCMAPAKLVALRVVGASTTGSYILSALVVVGCGIVGPVLISKLLVSRSLWVGRLLMGEGWK